MMMLSQECFLKVYQKTHEILICIKKSKNDKASGDNMVRNEVIKYKLQQALLNKLYLVVIPIS
jgi:hypothetical protein